MEIVGVHHIGKVVVSIPEELKMLKALGFEVDEQVHADPHQKVRVGIARRGDLIIELLEPDGEGSPIRNTPAGLNHLCLAVKDIDRYIREVKESGVGFPLTAPSPSVFGSRRVAFFGTKHRDIYEVIES